MPTDELLSAPGNKPLLASAMANDVPRWVFDRPDKGEYSADLYAELRAERSNVTRLLRDGALADLDLIDGGSVSRLLDLACTRAGALFETERLVALERWLRVYA